MAEVGRPQKLTVEVQEAILSALRAGASRTAAAAYAGIHRSTLSRWLEQGHEEDRLVKHQRHREFRAAVEQAEAAAHVRDATLLARAADQDWRAALARLQHIHWARERRRDADSEPGVNPAKEASEASPQRRITATSPAADIDVANPKERELLSELLRVRQADR